MLYLFFSPELTELRSGSTHSGTVSGDTHQHGSSVPVPALPQWSGSPQCLGNKEVGTVTPGCPEVSPLGGESEGPFLQSRSPGPRGC